MVDFMFVYEHVNREIENNVLIMEELRKRGYTCDITSFYGPDYVKRRLLRKRGRVVIVPWLRFDEDLYRFMSIAEKPYKIVDAQCEQVSSDMSANDIKVQSDVCKKALYFCWGENRKLDLINDGVDEVNSFVVGAVQLDYGRKEFDDYFFSHQDIANNCGLNAKKRWILFVSSFSSVAWSKYDVDAACKTFGEKFREYYKIEIKTYHRLLKWVDKFCNTNDCEFIYRPHPSETRTEVLKKLSDRYENFHIISDYSVKQWGKVCDSVNLWISTSNAELFSLGIDYNVIRPYKVPIEYDIHTFIGDDVISNYDKFEKVLCGIKLENDDSNHSIFRNNVFEKYYSYDIAVPSYIRFADALEEVYKKPQLSFQLHIPFAKRNDERITFLKDVLKAIIIYINKMFPKLKIVEKIPIKDGTRNLLRIRCNNYSNKNEIIEQMQSYIHKHEFF